MGRDLLQVDEREWWIVETVSEYQSRQSKPFVSKEEAIETLRKGGCRESVLKELKDCGHVASMIIGGSGMYSPGVEIGNALAKMDALCPDGEHSLYEDVECAMDACTKETVNWNGVESICGDCEEEAED